MATQEVLAVEDAEEEALITLDLIKDCIDRLKADDDSDLSSLSESIKGNTERASNLFSRCALDDWPKTPPAASLHQVSSCLIPLATSLGQLYEVMDKRAPSGTTATAVQTTPASKTAPPPPGLLSLRNYTDICVLVEIIVCIMILPAVPSYILLPIHERLRYQIPQSIAGRLDRGRVQKLYEQSCKGDGLQKEQLSLVLPVLGRLLLLDRFRPMLFPRHRTDLFAATLCLANATKSNDMAKLGICPKLLHCLGIDDGSSLSSSSRSDAIGQAQTYQSLLRYGRQAPLWLHRTVGRRLHHLAHQDLGAVLLVFVASAPERSAAAQRLAVALVCDDGLIEHLFRLLDGIHEAMEQKEAEAIVLTLWAVLAREHSSVERSVHILAQDMSLLLPRLQTLWTIPPKTYLGYRLLFSPLIQGQLSLLGLLVRIATQRSVLHSTVRSTAMNLWQTILQAAADSVGDRDALAVGLLQSLAPCPWDEQFEVRLVEETISLHGRTADGTIEQRVQAVEQRTTCLCEQMQSHPLVFSFFRAVLVCFVSSVAPLPNLDSMVPLVVLPALCESVPLESLFLQDGTMGLFSVMLIVFSHLVPHGDAATSTATLDPSQLQGFVDYSKCIRLAHVVESSRSTADGSETTNGEAKAEVLASIASVLLTILVSILELGSSTRSDAEEVELRSLAFPLQQLSSRAIVAHADEMAEMASHALVLLQARSALPSASPASTSVDEKWQQAQKDLESSEPPLRARGVATLRNLANGLPSSSSVDDQQPVSMSELLQLTIRALGDEESYVYLASIHTLVSIAAADPSSTMPLLSSCFLTGILVMDHHEPTVLSLDQRAKLTEAMAFIVRRGISLSHQLPRLLDLLCFGPRESTPLITVMDENQEKEIQTTTHKYFVGKAEERKLDEHQYWDDAKLRVKTGGPLFVEEEGDLVRSGRILIASELVSVLSPEQISPHVSLLMDCCIDALRLELSRPVRRAAANLARQIYGAVEQEEARADYIKAVATGRHAVLLTVLERCVSSDDLGDTARQKKRDEATVARCQEALELVAQASNVLLLGAAAVQEEREQRAQSSTPLFLLESSSETGHSLPCIRPSETGPRITRRDGLDNEGCKAT